jgi:hypothetical protein
MILNNWADPIAYTRVRVTVTLYVLENSVHEQEKLREAGEGRTI